MRTCPGLPRRRPVRQDRDLNPPRIVGLFRGRTGKTARPRPAGRQAALRPQLGPVRDEEEWLSRTALVALVLLIVLGLLLGPVLLVIACWPCSWPGLRRGRPRRRTVTRPRRGHPHTGLCASGRRGRHFGKSDPPPAAGRRARGVPRPPRRRSNRTKPSSITPPARSACEVVGALIRQR